MLSSVKKLIKSKFTPPHRHHSISTQGEDIHVKSTDSVTAIIRLLFMLCVFLFNKINSLHVSRNRRDKHASHEKRIKQKNYSNRARFIKLVIPLLLLEYNSFLMLVCKLGLLLPPPTPPISLVLLLITLLIIACCC